MNVSTSKARFYYETKLRARISQSWLADDTADTPLKNTHTHTHCKWMEWEGGRPARSVHAESDLTLSLPGATQPELIGAGDLRTRKRRTTGTWTARTKGAK